MSAERLGKEPKPAHRTGSRAATAAPAPYDALADVRLRGDVVDELGAALAAAESH